MALGRKTRRWKHTTTNDINKIIERCDLLEDYLVRQLAHQLPSGVKTENIYYFHPRALGLILASSGKN